MKIGLVTDSLGHLTYEKMLDTAAALGIEGLEFNACNWTSSPHFNLADMLKGKPAQGRLQADLKSRNLQLIALNANGNQLHPTEGKKQSDDLFDTIRVASDLGVSTVVCMSGLPGGGPGEKCPNWIVSSWPPETQTILRYQWTDVLLPYWHKLAAHAKAHGVRLAVELHGNQVVYNVPTLLRLRKEIGDTVGANLDPSHLMWMGADAIAAIDALGPAIYHTHAKDTFINTPVAATTSRFENGSLMDIRGRAWSYITLGYGNGESWWRSFCYRLRMAGYDGWLAIEHEDVMLQREEGVKRSVALLRNVAPSENSDYKPQEF
jgi:sugar phosphate isomerase/epimerase